MGFKWESTDKSSKKKTVKLESIFLTPVGVQSSEYKRSLHFVPKWFTERINSGVAVTLNEMALKRSKILY